MDGRALRSKVPRSSHAGWSPPPGRPDPVDVLMAQNASRVPELVPVRMGRMVESPFAFFRGSAAVMAADLASTPSTGIEVQACGDAHLLNFGLFASPERTLLFDINDFDETLPAPWEWDVKRLAASAVVAARQNGYDQTECAEAGRAAVRSYRLRMSMLAEMSALDLYYSRVDVDAAAAVMSSASRKMKKRALSKARRNTSARALEKLTASTDGKPAIVDQPPIVYHPSELASQVDEVRAVYDRYRTTLRSDVRTLLDRFHFADLAVKVVGVGSVGTRCFIALLFDELDSPLFLQVKEAEASVLEAHWKPAAQENHGHRVVAGQQIMQAASDIFLGWTVGIQGYHFYVRQLRDMKWSVDPSRATPSLLLEYLELCGWALARGHAQSGQAEAIAGYMGRGSAFDEAVVKFAVDYADHTERDHKNLLDAVDSGRLAATPGL
jgi:uncharacterized protein (DUF2252 family)